MKDHSSEIVKACDEVKGRSVKNLANDDLGKIIEIMLDKVSGRVAYVVLESGSFLGLGGKLFALPWNAISFDPENKCFILNIDKSRIKDAPGFDKDNWPNMADRTWGETTHQFYGAKNYWE